MRIPTNIFLYKDENNKYQVRYLKKNELTYLAIFLKLKALHTNSTVFVPSKKELARKIRVHHATLEKALKYLFDNNYANFVNIKGKRVLKLHKLIDRSDYNKYKAHLIHKIRRSQVLNSSVDEVKTIIANIILKIHTSQQKYKRDESCDRVILENEFSVNSSAEAKKRSKLLKTKSDGAKTKDENLITIVTDKSIAKYLGVSNKTANKIKHKIHNSGFAFFATLEKTIEKMSKLQFQTLAKFDMIPKNCFWKDNKLKKTIGTAFYPTNKKIENGFIQRFDTKEILELVIKKKEVLLLSDNTHKGILHKVILSNHTHKGITDKVVLSKHTPQILEKD